MDDALVWFRRDLRLDDNAALYQALRSARRVHCAFVFDRAILDPLIADGVRADRRVEFILASVQALAVALQQRGAALIVLHGKADDEIVALAERLQVAAVYANHDYEPAAIDRDQRVASRLMAAGRALHTSKDQVVFERAEVMTAQGEPFSVFTPYRNAWLRRLDDASGSGGAAGTDSLAPYPVDSALRALAAPAPQPGGGSAPIGAMPTLQSLGFAPSNLAQLRIPVGSAGAAHLLEDFAARIDRYAAVRDFPALKGPSYLSLHLRFGTLSIRAAARAARQRIRELGAGSGNGPADPAGQAEAPDGDLALGARTWLSELIWRDFYQMILYHHPRVVGESFRPEFDRIAWDDAPQRLAAWCEGRTGYPLVDAAMAQINRTGYMHNRLRMVVASFLTKDLGIDWRHGERYFARHLNDFDLAANNGGWQWAASSGCDAQPYFRIFNPVLQSERFDPNGAFIRRYLPQLAGFTASEIHAPWRVSEARQRAAGCIVGADYPAPIVDHAQARQKTLQRYAVVRRGAPASAAPL